MGGAKRLTALCAAAVLGAGCTAAPSRDVHAPAAASPGVTTAIPAPSPVRTARGRGWRLEYVGDQRGIDLQAVAASGPRDVWALGGPYEGIGKLLLLHFDGRRWRERPAPEVTWDHRDHERFPALVATGPRDAWIFAATAAVAAHHWDGERWSRVPLPDMDYNAGEGTGAAALAPDDVWLTVGDHAAHWDGRAWTVTRLPAWAASVSAAAPGQVWAVGGTGPPSEQGGSGSQAATMRWDGRSWRLVPAPEDRTPSRAMNSEGKPDGSIPSIRLTHVVAHGPGDVWATGTRSDFDYEDGSVTSSIAMHWDGTAWSWVRSPAEVSASGSDGAGGIILVDQEADEGGLSGTIRIGPDGSRTGLPRMAGVNRRREVEVSAVSAVPGTGTVYAVGLAYGKHFGPMIARYR
ncbi:hypothetical protein GCM10010140_07660 [Streptosporangium pseudovulgare]|uniref:Uncharacterized protein n=1 Tax=Streptosporangium pseudovulgare TaxID=35765 RepID=A0ABQ2QGW9_9ACTN|nr:hypothetical protein GCM10010140_07660 [Streptosporangium pseudovulgare]